MKKIFKMCTALLMTLAVTGCGVSAAVQDNGTRSSTDLNLSSTQTDESTSSESKPEDVVDSSSETAEENKKLVVYFSMPETTAPNNMSREEELSTVVVNGEVLGNTQYIARLIAENTGADIFRIEPSDPYPMDHSKLEDIAQREQRENARPEITGMVENMEQYDVVFFGFPNWYYDMPMIMYSFLDQYDLSGKTIVPFVTSGASGFSNSISTIISMEPNADVLENGLSIIRTKMQNSESDVKEWLENNGFIN